MTTSTKNKTTTTAVSFVEIEAASARFVPPPLDMLPTELHDAQRAVLICRAAWLTALNHKRHADRVASDAKAVHKMALNQAALDGADLSKVTDERPAKAHAQAVATEQAAAALAAVETRWRELADGIAAHRDAILADLHPDVEAAEAALADLDAKAAAQRQVTHRLRDQYAWLATIARSTTGRPTTEQGAPFQ